MVIHSSFKDYYDFVAKQYGGGDPKIVYARGRLAPPGKPREVLFQGNVLRGLNYRRGYLDNIGYQEMYIVVAGKAYLAVRNWVGGLPPIDIEDPNTYRLGPQEEPEEEKKLPFWRRRWKNYGVEFGKEYPSLVELCRLVGAPVFAVTEVRYQDWTAARLMICDQCPILSRIGFPALISPEQMYQEISMFMGNRMKEPPDTSPPVRLSNRERILKAGFDLAQSFRHRK